MYRRAELLLALLLVAPAAYAGPQPLELGAEVPKTWETEPIDFAQGQTFFSGRARIEVRRLLPGAGVKSSKAAVSQAYEEVKRVFVAGKKARLWRRIFNLGGAAEEWVHEEIVVVETDSGPVRVSFKETSSVRREKPRNQKVWERFLDTLRIS